MRWFSHGRKIGSKYPQIQKSNGSFPSVQVSIFVMFGLSGDSSGVLSQYGIQEPIIIGRRSARSTMKKKPRKLSNTKANRKANKKSAKNEKKIPRKGKSGSKSDKIKERKKKRKQKRKEKKKQKRKQKRRNKRRQKRKRMKKIEKSALGKAIPRDMIPKFKENFKKGRMKSAASRELRFLKKMDFPYKESGSEIGKLRSDFRSLVKKKVINKLPDYCEQTKLEKSDKMKKECSNRAQRIRERIAKRHRKKG